LHRVGTEANLLRYVTSPDGSHHVICQGERRFRVTEFLDGYTFFVARVEPVPETEDRTPKSRPGWSICASGARNLAAAAADPGELVNAVQSGDLGAGARRSDRQLHGHHPGREAGILETFAIERRLERVSELLSHRLEVLRLSRQISDRTRRRSTIASASSCCASS